MVVVFVIKSAKTSSAGEAKAEKTRRCDCPQSVVDAAVRITSEIKQPVQRRRVEVVFPESPKKHRGSGAVICEAIITKSGEVCGVRPLRLPTFDPPWPEFFSLVESAICQWKYEPAVLKGKPVAVFITVTITIRWAG